MNVPILTTKIYIPSPRSKSIWRSHLLERMNEGMHCKLILISAPAGYGKTTLVSEWVTELKQPVAWLTLDEGDNDSTRFLTYFIAALQTLVQDFGQNITGLLQSTQPLPMESVLTTLLNEIANIPHYFTIVLDDYHVIDAEPIHDILAFLIKHMPPQMHFVITTREYPFLPLARLRVRNQLTELRAIDLRFTMQEADDFLNRVMGLKLSDRDVAALETQTEGWIAGLQLAAISLKDHKNVSELIKSFTGSHHYVLDYLVEEVLQQQSEQIRAFLLYSSILDRMCGPLCDAVLQTPFASAQETLEYLERANLFLIPMDNEHLWFRYHHLFSDLLQQQLNQSTDLLVGDKQIAISELHLRASIWYENNGLEIEALHHAAAANDIERVERLIDGKGMPMYFRGIITPVLNWIEKLPKTILDTRPSLWVIYASALMLSGHPDGVEEKLQTAEAALQNVDCEDKTRNLEGKIAAMRALLATARNDLETIIEQSRRALMYLDSGNLAIREAVTFAQGYAYQLQGNRAEASRSYAEVRSIAQKSENFMITIAATFSLGKIQEAENQLYLAAETYRSLLQLVGDPEQGNAIEAHLGLSRISYEWNDLNTAEYHAQLYIRQASHIECYNTLPGEVLLARIKLARGDTDGALDILVKAEQFLHNHGFDNQLSEVVATKVLIMLRVGNLTEAVHLSRAHKLPLCLARAYLVQGDTSAALTVLESLSHQDETKNCVDEQLKIKLLHAITLYAQGDKYKALHLLADALLMAEPGGFLRSFIDEGKQMFILLSEAITQGIMPDYTGRLLSEFKAQEQIKEKANNPQIPAHINPLSQRELEILQLIAQGLSNHEISQKLFLALDTVKGHNQRIYSKLQVQRRTEAIARARNLGLL